MTKPPISFYDDDVIVTCFFKISFCKFKGQRIYLNGYNQTICSDDFSRNSCPIARPQTDLKKRMTFIQTQGLIKQRVAVRA